MGILMQIHACSALSTHTDTRKHHFFLFLFCFAASFSTNSSDEGASRVTCQYLRCSPGRCAEAPRVYHTSREHRIPVFNTLLLFHRIQGWDNKGTFSHSLIYTVHFMHCLYKMIDPMKNLINPQNRIRMSLIRQSQFPIHSYWIGNWLSGQSESPPRGITGAHLDVKPRTNIVRVHKVSLHFIVKAAWVFVFWFHHLSKHFVFFVPL